MQAISIHLMFLLILKCCITQTIFSNFNTSHVSINRLRGLLQSFDIIISIHLMFLLIGMPPYIHTDPRGISIHLMFLLIAILSRWSRQSGHFNTSHVSINLYGRERSAVGMRISIHLMFLLIGNAREKWELLTKFQYISCFY